MRAIRTLQEVVVGTLQVVADTRKVVVVDIREQVGGIPANRK